MAAKKTGKSRSRRKRKQGAKYKPISFKLTVGQKKALESYCKSHDMTPIRFMKSLVNSHVARYRNDPPPPSYVTENQLKLFDAETG